MFERVEIGGCVLIHGDCRGVLPALEADAVVSDLPYGIALRNGDVDGHRSDRWDSIMGDDTQETGLAVLEWARAKPERTIVVFASPELPWPGRWRNRIVWNKGGAVGGGGDIATCLKRSWELVQVWNPRPINGPRAESVWHHPIVPADTALHIAAKPLILMRRLLQVFTLATDTIIDPCMGSGSTLVAAVQLGRRAIGIESDRGHFETACRRLEEASGKGGLFETPAPSSTLFTPASVETPVG